MISTELLKSGKSTTGYWCIVKFRNKFYIKKKLDAEKGSKKMKVFAGHPTAREAAITFAEYLDAPYELPETKGKSREKRLEKLYGEAWELLQLPNPAWSEEETAAKYEEAGLHDRAAIRRQLLSESPTASVVAEDPLPPQPVPQRVLARNTSTSLMADPALLAKIAALKAGPRVGCSVLYNK